ncbi:hypothetical protein POTOM_030435 [Populus tomentosa]|uniref:RRM domain-containing protein n=1 Tax=Populus tomentosa TaxID=118781 RepID=A0A8X7Z788_POPTO|nr:hypothetical protein POTOM_030435 [Populus tomentosa]
MIIIYLRRTLGWNLLPLPTRTLVLSSVPSEVNESLIKRELEVFGEVRGVQMERVGYGTVTVHFYDLRHAERALREIREQHMLHQARLRNFFIQNSESISFNIAPTPPPPARGVIAGCVVWAQFIIPSCNEVPDGQNQGTLVVFNLDPNVSTRSLKEIFQAFGAVKEVRETPLKRHQRFVEFYDVRDAAKALGEMNGKEIYGKQVDIEFSRPGGHGKRFFNARPRTTSKNSFTTPVFDSTTNLRHSKVAAFVSPQPPPLLHRFSSGCSPPNVSPRSFLSETQSSAGKKPSGDPSEGNPIEASIEASLGCLSMGGDVIVGKVAYRGPPKRSLKKSQSFTSTKQQQKSAKSWKGSRQAKKLDSRFLISDESMVETSGSDSRTTVMIKNIPNKYSQKLLLNMLDNHCIHCNEQIANGDDEPLVLWHSSKSKCSRQLSFIYSGTGVVPLLNIFVCENSNKCNVGYGFVNLTSPQAAWRLYKAFHNQHWEVFSSRKICAVTYARVQGLEALKEHFKNSKFPCEMDHHLPVVFSPPRDGRQQTEPLPIICHKHNQQPINIILGDSIACTHHEIDGVNDSLKTCNKLFGDTDQEGENQLKCSSSSSQNGGDTGDDDKDSSSGSS